MIVCSCITKHIISFVYWTKNKTRMWQNTMIEIFNYESIHMRLKKSIWISYSYVVYYNSFVQ